MSIKSHDYVLIQKELLLTRKTIPSLYLTSFKMLSYNKPGKQISLKLSCSLQKKKKKTTKDL